MTLTRLAKRSEERRENPALWFPIKQHWGWTKNTSSFQNDREHKMMHQRINNQRANKPTLHNTKWHGKTISRKPNHTIRIKRNMSILRAENGDVFEEGRTYRRSKTMTKQKRQDKNKNTFLPREKKRAGTWKQVETIPWSIWPEGKKIKHIFVLNIVSRWCCIDMLRCCSII